MQINPTSPRHRLVAFLGLFLLLVLFVALALL